MFAWLRVDQRNHQLWLVAPLGLCETSSSKAIRNTLSGPQSNTVRTYEQGRFELATVDDRNLDVTQYVLCCSNSTLIPRVSVHLIMPGFCHQQWEIAAQQFKANSRRVVCRWVGCHTNIMRFRWLTGALWERQGNHLSMVSVVWTLWAVIWTLIWNLYIPIIYHIQLDAHRLTRPHQNLRNLNATLNATGPHDQAAQGRPRQRSAGHGLRLHFQRLFPEIGQLPLKKGLWGLLFEWYILLLFEGS